MQRWPTSSPRLAANNNDDDIPNQMEIISGERGKTLIIDWIYWIRAWSVVISDPGSYAL